MLLHSPRRGCSGQGKIRCPNNVSAKKPEHSLSIAHHYIIFPFPNILSSFSVIFPTNKKKKLLGFSRLLCRKCEPVTENFPWPSKKQRRWPQNASSSVVRAAGQKPERHQRMFVLEYHYWMVPFSFPIPLCVSVSCRVLFFRHHILPKIKREYNEEQAVQENVNFFVAGGFRFRHFLE